MQKPYQFKVASYGLETIQFVYKIIIINPMCLGKNVVASLKTYRTEYPSIMYNVKS